MKAGGLIDGTGGPIMGDAVIEISDGAILTIGSHGYPALTEGRVTDFTGCTLLPGLVDSHVHLAMSGTDVQEIRKRQLDAPFEEIKDVISENLQEHFNQGIVAVRDGGDRSGHVLRYKRESLNTIGIPVAYRTAGRAWHSRGRYGAIIGRPPFEGMTLAGSIFRDYQGTDFIKIVNSGLNSLMDYGLETPSQFDLQALREGIRAAKELGLKTMVHANGREAVRMALEAGCHSIEHGFFMGDENLKRMADKGITWVPTMVTMDAYYRIPGLTTSRQPDMAKRNLDHQMLQVAKAGEYGVIIAAGTDSGSPGVRHGQALREEIRLMIQAGFSIERAIQAATSNGSILLDVLNHTGTLSAGMPATFIVAPGDPEDLPGSLESPVAVYVKGKRLKGSKIHHQI